MKTKFYLNGKKTTRKDIKGQVGEERLARMLKEAKETFRKIPWSRTTSSPGAGC